MTVPSLTCILTLHIPRPLVEACGSPNGVKMLLIMHHIWPERVTAERWRQDYESAGGYTVELEIDVPVQGE